MVGIAPAAAYLSTRSGRIPSDAKKITFSASGPFAVLLADAAPATAIATNTSTGASRTSPFEGLNRRVIVSLSPFPFFSPTCRNGANLLLHGGNVKPGRA